MKIFIDERGIKYTNESLLKGIAAHTQFNYIGDTSSDAFSNSYLFGPISSEIIDGIWIPDYIYMFVMAHLKVVGQMPDQINMAMVVILVKKQIKVELGLHLTKHVDKELEVVLIQL